MPQTYGYVAKLFLKSEFHHLREETNEKTGLLRKILWYSLQEHIQKIKLFIYYTEKAKKNIGTKLSSLGQEPTFNAPSKIAADNTFIIFTFIF